MPFWQFYQKSADWLDWPAWLVQPSISAHRKWPEIVVLASTNQVWTKIIIRIYAWSFAVQNPIEAVWYVELRYSLGHVGSNYELQIPTKVCSSYDPFAYFPIVSGESVVITIELNLFFKAYYEEESFNSEKMLAWFFLSIFSFKTDHIFKRNYFEKHCIYDHNVHAL